MRDFGRKVFSSSAATILSRLTGFVREVLLVALIGPSRLTDIFYFVYALPNMIRRVLGEGALVSAFLPAFTKIERENGTEAATDFASRVLYWQGVATGGFALLITLVLSAVWLLSEPGSYAGVYAEYGLVLAPYAFVICAVALLGAILNSRGIFFIPLSVQTVMNMVWIVVVLAVAFTIGPRHGLTLVGAGVVIACGLAVWYMARLAAAKGVTVRWTRGGGLTPEFRSFLGKFMLTLVGVASYPINLFADRLMAEFVVLREGAVTFLYQGDRLMQVPLGVIGLSIGSVALAALSAAAADHRRFHVLFSKTMTLAIFTAIPVVGVSCLLSSEIVDLSLNWMKFGTQAHLDPVGRTAMVLLCYSLAMPAFFANNSLTRAFYAMGDMRTPFRLSWWMVCLNIPLNVLLLWTTKLDESALALSSAMVAYVNGGLLLYMLRKRAPWLSLGSAFKHVPHMIAAGIAASAVLLGAVAVLGEAQGGAFTVRLVRFAVPATAFIGVYFGVSWLLGVRDARKWMWRKRK